MTPPWAGGGEEEEEEEEEEEVERGARGVHCEKIVRRGREGASAARSGGVASSWRVTTVFFTRFFHRRRCSDVEINYEHAIL